MRNLFCLVLTLASVLTLHAGRAYAFKHQAVSLGVAYYTQNALFSAANSDDGSTGLFGEASFPLFAKADLNFYSDWYFSPQLGYTIFPRESVGSSALTTFTQLAFTFGKNFAINGDTLWDWSFGTGYMMYQIKGSGGTTVLNNGTSTSTFAMPGRTAKAQKVTFNFGSSYSYGRNRFGLDLIFESLFSLEKRTQSLMFSYAYQFGGDGY